jgi:quercetin dioxygenase-like cupin family protein
LFLVIVGGCSQGATTGGAGAAVGATATTAGGAAAAGAVTEKVMLDNERVTIYEYVFPAGFQGEEHAAIADELAYVLDGEFTVVTRGRGRRTIKAGEVEYARKGVLHLSLNETKTPARVLVVLLKER